MSDAARAARIIADERDTHPRAVELAVVCSLAARIDPPLLRALRTRFVRGADASAEADLWFGPLVQFRSREGVILEPTVAQALRDELRWSADLKEVWSEQERRHAHLPFLVKLEERLAWLSCSEPGDGPVDAPLHGVLATMQREQGRRDNLGAWFLRALPRLPARVRSSSAAWALALGSGARLRVTPLLAGAAPAGVAELLPPELLPPPDKDVAIAVERRGENLYLSLAKAGAPGVLVPATTPLVIEVHTDERAWGVAVSRDTQTIVPVSGATVRLRTLRGDEHEVRAVAKIEKAVAEPLVEVEVSIGPLPVTHLDVVGRDRELAWLDAQWAESANVASIIAWGGSGKSCLVNAWLRRMRDDHDWGGAERVYGWSFHDGGDTDRLTSADEFIDSALRWFGDETPTEGTHVEKGERLAHLVQEKKTLLILDGLDARQWGPGRDEGKLEGPALQTLVRELNAQNEGLCVITSRVRLPDEAWDGAVSLDLDGLSLSAGVALLRNRGVQGTEEELTEAVREYGGHPLALNLLGYRLEDAGRGDVRRRREIGPLEDEEHLGGRARDMMSAYETWLHDRPEIAILDALGLFDGPANRGEIDALRASPPIRGLTEPLVELDTTRWESALATLRRLGLLSVEAADGQLDAHRLVREHFGKRLKRENPEAFREGHRRLYEHLRSTAKALPDTLEEMAPLYEAVVHGCLAGRAEEALEEVYLRRIQRGNEGFASQRLGAFQQDLRVLSAFFDPPWDRLVEGLSEQEQSVVVGASIHALRAAARLHEAATLLRGELSRSAARGNFYGAATMATDAVEVLLATGQIEEAVRVAQQGVDFADRSGEPTPRTICSAELAYALLQAGRDYASKGLFEDAEQLRRDSRPERLLLSGLQSFQYCEFLLDRDREGEVVERAKRAVAENSDDDAPLDVALTHLSLGKALQKATRGRPDWTELHGHINMAVDGARRAGDPYYLLFCLLARADLHFFTSVYDMAQPQLEEVLSLSVRSGFRLHEADAYLALARLAVRRDAPDRARKHLTSARAIIEATGYHRRDGALAELDAMLTKPPAKEPGSPSGG